MTDEQYLIEEQLRNLGIRLLVSHVLASADRHGAVFDHALTNEPVRVALGTLILVTGRVPVDMLFQSVKQMKSIKSVTRIGDCLVPSSIADAVFSGHRFAREFGEARSSDPVRRERPAA